MQISTRQMRLGYIVASALLAGGLTAGCSVTDLSGPITEMSTAVERSATAIEQLDAKFTGAMNESWRRDIINYDAKLRSKKTCLNKEKACSLVVKKVRDREWTDFPVASVMPEVHENLKALKGYVGALRAIVNADTAAKITASANQALGSAQNIDDELTKSKETESSGLFAKYETPVEEAVKWLAGQYVEAVKYRALAQVTNEADPIIAKLALLQEEFVNTHIHTELTDVSRAYRKKQKEYRRKVKAKSLSKSDIREFVAAAGDYDKALKVSHSKPLKDFVDAHAKLTRHLNVEGEISLSEVLSYIGRLLDEVNTFKGLVENFTNLNEEAK